MGKIHSDIYISVVMLVISISLTIMTFDMPEGPEKFPRIILFFLTIFSIYILATGIKKSLKNIDSDRKFINIKHPIISFILIFLYIFLIDKLGFFSSTSVFMIAFMLYYNIRNYITVALCLLGLNLFVYVLFVYQLNIQLPTGILF